MSRFFSMLFVVLISCALLFGMGITVSAAENEPAAAAEEETAEAPNATGNKAFAAAACVGIAAAAGAIGMAIAVGRSTESMARQPEAADKINSSMMLGLVFIETAIIYALIVAILVIFVL